MTSEIDDLRAAWPRISRAMWATLFWALICAGWLELLGTMQEHGFDLFRPRYGQFPRISREAISAYTLALVPFWLAAVLRRLATP